MRAVNKGVYNGTTETGKLAWGTSNYCSSMDVTVESKDRGMPTLDVHNHSKGAAETALFWWIEKNTTSKLIVNNPLITRLQVITGKKKDRNFFSFFLEFPFLTLCANTFFFFTFQGSGKHRPGGKGVLRISIELLLQEMQIPTVVSDNPGSFLIDFRNMLSMKKKLGKVRKRMRKKRMQELYEWDSTTNGYVAKGVRTEKEDEQCTSRSKS